MPTLPPFSDYAEIQTREQAREHIGSLMGSLIAGLVEMGVEPETAAEHAHEGIRRDAHEVYKRAGFAWEVDPTGYSADRHFGAGLVLSELEVWP